MHYTVVQAREPVRDLPRARADCALRNDEKMNLPTVPISGAGASLQPVIGGGTGRRGRRW